MLPFICLIIGAGLGWLRATRRGGVLADKAQYAIGHGLAGGLLGMLLGVVLGWSGLFGAG